MIIVAGSVQVAPGERDAYVAGCRAVVEQARATEGCLDFAIDADAVDPARVNVYERWGSRAALTGFRGDGAAPEGLPEVVSADVLEFEVAGEPTRP